MITFERSQNYELIRAIFTHPKVYRHLVDDNSPDADEFRPLESDAIWYIVARDGSDVLGLWMLHPQNSVCWEIHTVLLPCAWGTRAVEAGKLLPDWIWANVPGCLRVVTNVPVFNRVAVAYAKRVGMRLYGVNPASFVRHGYLWDQVMFGISPQSRQEGSQSIETPQEVSCLPQ